MDTHTVGRDLETRPAQELGLRFTEYDTYLFREGSHLETYKFLGAHPRAEEDEGVDFAVWAPNASRISVIGDFNSWEPRINPLSPSDSGIWYGTIKTARRGHCYKYHIENDSRGYRADKADPYAFRSQLRPQTASIIAGLTQYQWRDKEWMAQRRERDILKEPLLVYEIHLGSWRRNSQGDWLTYRELAEFLPLYLKDMGFTHVEFLPITEHPLDSSWGYQTTGYYAPTSRFGTPEDFKYLIEALHLSNIGVILDWVPGHFPNDAHGLVYFDGTHLYEHADPRQGAHPDWGTMIFNYSRHEVRNFLLSNALYWLREFHIDGLRIDAVASMLYLDYSRKGEDWIPNRYGGRENLEAIDFLRRLNNEVNFEAPGAFTVAEESTAWPLVSRPTHTGGLGFNFKWNMGWMNDTLTYMHKEPIHRKYHHSELTFSLLYAFSENFLLPISHDEVVHGKGSLLNQMPGDMWQKFANLRLLLGHMYAHPGKKLLFMGCELGEWEEWNSTIGLHWNLTEFPLHRGVQRWLRDLNMTVRTHPALYSEDSRPEGFSWIDCTDNQQSIVSYIRYAPDSGDELLIVCNFTPEVRENYRIGATQSGYWQELLNSDSEIYGGSNQGNGGGLEADSLPFHGRPYSLKLRLPPLAVLFFKPSP